MLGTVLGRAGARIASDHAGTVRQVAANDRSPWFGEGATTRALISVLRSAGEQGLDPDDYGTSEIEREVGRSHDPGVRARAEQLLRTGLADYARDLRIPRSVAGTVYVDPELAPTPPSASELLTSTQYIQRLQHLQDRNPLYNKLRVGLKWYRARWSSLPQSRIAVGPAMTIGSSGDRVTQLRRRLGLSTTGVGVRSYDEALARAVSEFRQVHGLPPSVETDSAVIDALNLGSAHYERLIALNLDRVRGLPLNEPRYVFVDAAGARLLLIEDGRVVDTMRVVVGKPGMETPALAGRIRFAMINPRWNVPPDLVRHSIAPAVLREGRTYLGRRRFVVFSGWQPTAPEQDPQLVEWQAVADGTQEVWVRQSPGGDNMMGRVKFMLPNRLGIYLHDTPYKADFARSDRRLSSGCVRVEDARRLAAWLFRSEVLDDTQNTPDRRVDLPEAVPVYISYLTAIPEGGEVRFQQDVYHRDRAALSLIYAKH